MDDEPVTHLTANEKYWIGVSGGRLVDIVRFTEENDHRKTAANVIKDVMNDLQAVLKQLEG